MSQVEEEEIEFYEYFYMTETEERNFQVMQNAFRATGPTYTEPNEISEFVYYLHNLKEAKPFKNFVYDENDEDCISLYALDYLKNCERSRAILHYMMDEGIVNLHGTNNSMSSVMMSCFWSHDVTLKLVNYGADINIVSPDDGCCVLHYSRWADTTKLFLRSGADVNLCNNMNETPLHWAFACFPVDLDKIIILLQNGGNLYDREKNSLATPIELAVIRGKFQDIILLCEYFSDIFPWDLLYEITLRLCNFKVTDLIDYYILLHDSRVKMIESQCYDFFRLLWKGKSQNFSTLVRINVGVPLIDAYLNNFSGPVDDWYDCLKLMLISTIGPDLIAEYVDYKKSGIFTLLLSKLHALAVTSTERIYIIKLWLSLGAQVSFEDIGEALLTFGFKEEVELLIMNLKSDYLNNYNKNNHLEYLGSIICGNEEDFEYEFLFSKQFINENYTTFIIQNFTPPLKKIREESIESLDVSLSKFISLKELSKNAVIKFIRNNGNIQHPKTYFRLINNLRVPRKIIEYILFKSTLAVL